MTCIEVVGFLLIFKICLCGQLLRWTTWCFLINIRCLCDVLTSHVFDLKWDINFDTDAIAGKSIKKWKHYSFTYITYIKTNFVINKNTSIWFLLFLFCIHVVYELLCCFFILVMFRLPTLTFTGSCSCLLKVIFWDSSYIMEGFGWRENNFLDICVTKVVLI